MNVQQLVKRLRREMTANPKKAIILGLVLLVGVYFWAPLLASWMGSGNTPVAAKASDASADLVPSFTAMLTAQTAAKPKDKETEKQHSWSTLAEWLDRDDRTTAADPQVVGRNPFCAVVEKKEIKVALPKVIKTRLTPQQLAMSLEGTMIGRQRKMAVIDGRGYQLGDTIKVRNRQGSAEFELSEIESHSAVLTLGGERFVLRIPRRDENESRELAKDTRR